MSREGAPRRRGRRVVACCVWLLDNDTGSEGPALTFGREQYGGVAVQVGDVLFRPAEGDFRVWEKRRKGV